MTSIAAPFFSALSASPGSLSSALRRLGAILCLALLAGLGSGCSTIMAVNGQQQRSAERAVVSGTVTVEGTARGPLFVGLATKTDAGYRLVDFFAASVPGPWAFAVAPGTYWLAAFEDVNGDGRYDNEPALQIDPAQPIVLGAGARIANLVLHIPLEGRFQQGFVLQDLVARDADEQSRVSLFALSVAGQLTTLADPRFSREKAAAGLWKYYDFLLEAEPGIYFLETYDPAKIPVLFVHGISGTPLDFETMIAGLDRTRFQPWVFYYPSGAPLETVTKLLTQLFTRLRVEHRFARAVVVAHSMGGLVSREFLLQGYESNHDPSVQLYVTISAPLGGMPSAGMGVRRSPVVVHSWRALAPGSAFLDGLYFQDASAQTVRRRLPAHMAYHMLFGFKGNSGDGTVAIGSQLREEAQQEAHSIRGFDEDHTSILRCPAASAHLNKILKAL